VILACPFEQCAKEAYDYLVGLHNDGFFLQEPSLVWAEDFTSTAIKQQLLYPSIPRAHMCVQNIVTSLYLNGSILAPHGFSADPALGPNSPVKTQLCQQYDLDPDTVLFCPDSGNWVGETASMLYKLVKKYTCEDCCVMHDDGNS
jgi:hypothetical protein